MLDSRYVYIHFFILMWTSLDKRKSFLALNWASQLIWVLSFGVSSCTVLTLFYPVIVPTEASLTTEQKSILSNTIPSTNMHLLVTSSWERLLKCWAFHRPWTGWVSLFPKSTKALSKDKETLPKQLRDTKSVYCNLGLSTDTCICSKTCWFKSLM